MPNQLGLLKHRAKKKRGDAPSHQVARIGWLLLRLLHERAVEYAEYRDIFGRSLREFQRDLYKIRRIGKNHFGIEPIRKGRALLVLAPGQVSPLTSPRVSVEATLARIAAALGGPIASELRPLLGEDGPRVNDGFLQIREPLLAAEEAVTSIFESLKSAALDQARVEFSYRSRGITSVRRIEPYHVMFRAGRYYLVAYDLRRSDWRQFALDAIDASTLRRDGTFQVRRAVPARYMADMAAGWISGPSPTDVTFLLTPAVSAAVCSRQWQNGQRVTSHRDGNAEITLTFNDLGEAVRWGLQFGPDALIVSPPQAVESAMETAERIAEAYERSRQTAVARAV